MGFVTRLPLVPSGPLVYKHILVHYGQPCIYIIWVILRTNILDVLNSHDIKILINIYKPITDSYYIVIDCFPWAMFGLAFGCQQDHCLGKVNRCPNYNWALVPHFVFVWQPVIGPFFFMVKLNP